MISGIKRNDYQAKLIKFYGIFIFLWFSFQAKVAKHGFIIFKCKYIWWNILSALFWVFPWTWCLKIFSYFSTFLRPISIALLLTLHASYSKRSAVTPPPSTNNLAMVNLVMVKNIILCSNLSITVIKQNFWKKGHPVATYPYKSNLQYN